ncbi:MAG: dTDP-4-dehydrorhamnose 3,5-epimerase family protein [Miltoncostaeaceae bacterium]
MNPSSPHAVDALDAAPRDPATVSPAGESLRPAIDGVRTKRLVTHLDHRGRVMEIVNGDGDYWDEPVVFTYLFTVRVGQVKGWGIHETKRDRYCIVAGEMLVVLWDGRRDSPTYGMEQTVVLSPEGEQMLTIPIGVWHIDINVGTVECRVINHPTKPYDYENPDRRLLPWDTAEIPVDLSRYYPIQHAG